MNEIKGKLIHLLITKNTQIKHLFMLRLPVAAGTTVRRILLARARSFSSAAFCTILEAILFYKLSLIRSAGKEFTQYFSVGVSRQVCKQF